MIITLADLLVALPGPWRQIEWQSRVIKTPPQRERAELALSDQLTLALEVSTREAQERRLTLLGQAADQPLMFEVYLLNAQRQDAAPGILGLATTAEQAAGVAADKVTRAIVCGAEVHSLPPWLSFRVAERLRQAQDRLHRVGLRFVTDPAANECVFGEP